MRLFRLSKNQQHAALAKEYRNTSLFVNIETITPHQKPRHKLHLNNEFRNPNLQIILRGTLRIVPYFKIQCKPTQEINSNITSLLWRNYPELPGLLEPVRLST